MTTEAHLDAFERRRAHAMGVPVTFLHAHGGFAVPCDCGDDECEGIQFAHLRDKLVDAGWRPPAGFARAGDPTTDEQRRATVEALTRSLAEVTVVSASPRRLTPPRQSTPTRRRWSESEAREIANVIVAMIFFTIDEDGMPTRAETVGG